jgi:hypothetical protein
MTWHARVPLFLAVSLLAATLLHAQPGTTGLAFLKLGASGRSVAMGDAMSAVVSGAAATHANPAALVADVSSGNTADILFMHREWFQDTRSEFLAGLAPIGNDDAIGAMLTTTTVSDIEVRLRPGPPDGTFTARDFAAGLSYARRITPDVRVGLTGKFLYQKIYVDEATGYALDFGALWQTPVDNLTLGGTLANIGSMSKLRNDATTLPALLRCGPGYTLSLPGNNLVLVGAVEYMRILPEKTTYVNAGGEVTFNGLLAGRAGYQFGADARGFSTGLGIHYGKFSLDYAFAKIGADLGDGHTFSISLRL